MKDHLRIFHRIDGPTGPPSPKETNPVMETMTVTRFIREFRSLQAGSNLTVVFTKCASGFKRIMRCEIGAFSFSDLENSTKRVIEDQRNGTLTVKDADKKEFRRINLETLELASFDGVTFEITR